MVVIVVLVVVVVVVVVVVIHNHYQWLMFPRQAPRETIRNHYQWPMLPWRAQGEMILFAGSCIYLSDYLHRFWLQDLVLTACALPFPDGAEKVELIDCLKDCPDEKINPKCTASVYSDKMFTGNVP